MQNYRNNTMSYNAGYHTNYNVNQRRVAPTPPASDCCAAAVEDKMPCKNDMVLAMAYVKWQKWQNIYAVEKALHQGTIFQELDLPFCGTGGCQK